MAEVRGARHPAVPEALGKLIAGGLNAFIQRHGRIIGSWATVEAALRKEYGLDLGDIFRLSWRKLRLYVDFLFPPKYGQVEGTVHEDTSMSTIDEPYPDWQRALDSATGRESPTHRQKMTMDEFMRVAR